MKDFYQMSVSEVIEKLKSSETGLDEEEARRRLKLGPNEIIEKKKKTDLEIFFDQFKSFLILILIVAIIISAILGEIIDTAVIGAIIILNAVLGYLQTKKAEEALAALKKITAPTVKVIREGKVKIIAARELVPGDVILLNVGDKVPADCRIIEQLNLKVDESILTGESIPVIKDERKIDNVVPIYKRRNMLYSGTLVVYGRCEAIVTSTGMDTEFGKIAEKLQAPEEETPLQRKLDTLGKQLGILFILVCSLVFVIGLARGIKFIEILLVSISLAVAAVPEGLLAAITIALALGVNRMAKKKSIVKRLSAVEGLGSVSVICTDKTGTLTVNEMTVRKIWIPEKTEKKEIEVEVSGEGYKSEGTFYINEGKGRKSEKKEINFKDERGSYLEPIRLILNAGMFCNDAIAEETPIGDPTEIALLVAAKKASLTDPRKKYNRVNEIPFDSSRKLMSVLYYINKEYVVFTKGAVEEVINRCAYVRSESKIIKLKEEMKKRILEKNREYTDSAYRVLALAMKPTKSPVILEKDLVFLGLVAMFDPPRPEVKDAISLCKKAGIKVVMITGDHKNTAIAVAKELEILEIPEKMKEKREEEEKTEKEKMEGIVITGEELDKMSDSEFERNVDKICVYARTVPEQKLRIINALRKKGYVIAMTGDGINDVPAIKTADVGVAMGITGTDVTREAADIVISDDNFATIVTAVREGRGIYNNIKKCVAFLLSGNIAEVLIIFIALMLSLPLPLIAIQILWINLVTDGLPVLALAVDPIDKDVMNKKPRKKDEKITDGLNVYLIYYPIFLTLAALLLFNLFLDNLVKAQTIVFSTIVLFEILQSFSCRDVENPVVDKIFKNKFLVAAALIAILLQLIIIYIQPFQIVFNTSSLGLLEWTLIITSAFLAFVFIEIYKSTKRKRNK